MNLMFKSGLKRGFGAGEIFFDILDQFSRHFKWILCFRLCDDFALPLSWMLKMTSIC